MTDSAQTQAVQKGVVSEVFPRFCNVILDSDLGTNSGTNLGGKVSEGASSTSSGNSVSAKKLLCTYRRAQVIDKDAEWRERSPVAPGDLVAVKVLGSRDGVIEELFPRRNCIQRRAPGKEGKVVHTIAANIDYVVIVTSLHDPDFSPGLVDRFLIAAERAEITPVLVINKIDLRKNPEDRPWQLYTDLGKHCFPISNVTGEGIAEVKDFLRAKTSVFCGHSGVGKTSLLQQLFGVSVGKIGELSKSTGKGKHTTTVSTLVQTEDHTRFIDTPGIKEFGLIDVNPKDLIQYYPEM